MDYQESLTYLKRCSALGSKPGLETVRELLRRLGNPQDSLRIIHLAGTNGKGSVGCFLQSVLTNAGYRVGFFTSPFLFHYREMIKLGGEDISEDAFADLMQKVAEQADAMEQEGLLHPTEFEIMTAAAYLFFQREHCDFAIIEAGMGGGKDATNVMKKSEVSVLTRIDYDHVQFLGSTLTEITREKCGIFKENCPVVVYPEQEAETLSVIETEAEERGSFLVLPLIGSVVIEKSDAAGCVFSYGQWKHIQLSMHGRHQVYNAVTALAVFMTLRQKGVEISDDCIYEGLCKAKWQGRFELISKQPPVLLDGAHNVNGAKAFSQAVAACFPAQSFIGVVGMLRDKDFTASLKEFSKVCDRMIVTTVPNPRSATAEELFAEAQRLGIDAAVEPEPEQAVRRAFAEQKAGQGVFCVGSLYALPTYYKACQEYIKK